MRKRAGSLREEGANSRHSPLLISIIVTVSAHSSTLDRGLMLCGKSAVSSTVQSFFIYRIWFCAFNACLDYVHSYPFSVTRNRFRWLFPAILMPFVFAQLGEYAQFCVSRSLKQKESQFWVPVSVEYVRHGVRLTFDRPAYTVIAIAFQTGVSAVSGPLLTVRYMSFPGFMSL